MYGTPQATRRSCLQLSGSQARKHQARSVHIHHNRAMEDNARVVEAGQAIIPHLGSLLNPNLAASVAADLRMILRSAGDQEEAAVLISDLLARHPATRVWLKGFHPADQSVLPARDQDRIITIPGNPGRIRPYRFRCPQKDCDYIWFQSSVGEAVPPCEVHGIPLVEDEM